MKRLLGLVVALGLPSSPALSRELGKVTFFAEGRGLALDIESTGGIVTGDVKKDGDKVSGTFSTKLSAFKTGIGLRDEHMCKALECAKYPEATFTLSPWVSSAGDAPFEGELSLHGVKRKVKGTASMNGNRVQASFDIGLKDFGIEPPSYELAKLDNKIEVQVEITL